MNNLELEYTSVVRELHDIINRQHSDNYIDQLFKVFGRMSNQLDSAMTSQSTSKFYRLNELLALLAEIDTHPELDSATQHSINIRIAEIINREFKQL